jgi:histidinol dehydrogenase
LASAILVATSRKLVDEIEQEIRRQLESLSRRGVIEESLKNGIMALVSNIEEAIELANLYAPEHLCLMIDKPGPCIEKIVNAGCIVAGREATVVLGDYAAGPSHALPTGGTARFSSPLNVSDFIKFVNVIDVDRNTLKELGMAASIIARVEGFDAHARAVERRLKPD